MAATNATGPLEALVEAASGAHPIPESEAAAQANAEAAAAAAAAVAAAEAVPEQLPAEEIKLSIDSAHIPTDPEAAASAAAATAEIMEGVEAAAAVTLEQPMEADPLVHVEENDAVVAAATAAVAEANAAAAAAAADAIASVEAQSIVVQEETVEVSVPILPDAGVVSVQTEAVTEVQTLVEHSVETTIPVPPLQVQDPSVGAVELVQIIPDNGVIDNTGVPPLPGLSEGATLPEHQMEAVAVAPAPQQIPLPIDPAAIELAKNLPGSRIVERRRKGWVKKTWEERLEELKAYKAIHNHANVPTLSKENPSLGHWVHDQRKQYRLFNEKKQTAMTNSRIEQLEAVGFKWALQRHTTMKSWSERFEELKSYKAEKGNCNVPIRYKGNPSLGQWVSTQRQEYGARKKGQKSNITDDRIKTLEEVGFVWSLRDTSKMAPRKSWDAHYESLVEFKEKNGHCDVRVRSKQHPTGSLGRWVEKQRHHFNSSKDDSDKESKITSDQIKKLEDLGFKWRVRNEKRSVVERREALKAKAIADAKAQEDAVAEAKAQEETAAAVAAEVAATVEGTVIVEGVTAADVAAGVMPPIAGVTAADVAAGVMPPVPDIMSADVEVGVMPPVPGVQADVEAPVVQDPVPVHTVTDTEMPPVEVHVSTPIDISEIATVTTGMEVEMNHAVAKVEVSCVDISAVDTATAAAMEATDQAVVDANASMEVEMQMHVPVPEPARVPEIAMANEVPVPEIPVDNFDDGCGDVAV